MSVCLFVLLILRIELSRYLELWLGVSATKPLRACTFKSARDSYLSTVTLEVFAAQVLTWMIVIVPWQVVGKGSNSRHNVNSRTYRPTVPSIEGVSHRNFQRGLYPINGYKAHKINCGKVTVPSKLVVVWWLKCTLLYTLNHLSLSTIACYSISSFTSRLQCLLLARCIDK